MYLEIGNFEKFLLLDIILFMFLIYLICFGLVLILILLLFNYY